MSQAEYLVTAVLPTYNERSNIVPLIRRLTEALEGVPLEILVMDDRSPDGTAEVARQEARDLPHVQVIERQPPKGLTVSIRDGVQRARGRYVTWMDCDLSHPPELAPELLRPLREGKADLVLASRYAPGGADARTSRLTRAYSLVINRLCRWVVHPAVRDYTTGYLMAPRALVLDIGLHGDYGEYCIELLGKGALRGARIREVPYAMVDREVGESKTVPSLGGFVRHGWRYLQTVARLWWTKGEERRRPLVTDTTDTDETDEAVETGKAVEAGGVSER